MKEGREGKAGGSGYGDEGRGEKRKRAANGKDKR